jgi:hypothetical protein
MGLKPGNDTRNITKAWAPIALARLSYSETDFQHTKAKLIRISWDEHH